MEKTPKINKRTPMFIPESRVPIYMFSFLKVSFNTYLQGTFVSTKMVRGRWTKMKTKQVLLVFPQPPILDYLEGVSSLDSAQDLNFRLGIQPIAGRQ